MTSEDDDIEAREMLIEIMRSTDDQHEIDVLVREIIASGHAQTMLRVATEIDGVDMNALAEALIDAPGGLHLLGFFASLPGADTKRLESIALESGDFEAVIGFFYYAPESDAVLTWLEEHGLTPEERK